MKFLHMIFEALFMILDKKDQDFGEVVFDCIVFIICTLADHKFEHFRPVLDNYITSKLTISILYRPCYIALKNLGFNRSFYWFLN